MNQQGVVLDRESKAEEKVISETFLEIGSTDAFNAFCSIFSIVSMVVQNTHATMLCFSR